MWNDLYVVHKDGGYHNHPAHYEHIDPDDDVLADIYSRVEHMYQYRQEEQGLFHPLRKQGMRLRNNGMIDLFTQNDVGIRLDPLSQSIQEFANHKKYHLHSITSWLTGSSTQYIKKNLEFHVDGKTLMISKKGFEIKSSKGDISIDNDLNIKASGSMNITVAGNAKINVDGNLNAKVKRHATIEVNEDIQMKSKKDIHMLSERDIFIDAGRHLTTIQRCPDPSHYDPTKTHK